MDGNCSTCENYKPKVEPDELVWGEALPGQVDKRAVYRILRDSEDVPVLLHTARWDVLPEHRDLFAQAPRTAKALKAAEALLKRCRGILDDHRRTPVVNLSRRRCDQCAALVSEIDAALGEGGE